MSGFGGGGGFGAAPFGANPPAPAAAGSGQMNFGTGGGQDASRNQQAGSFGGAGGFQAWASTGQGGGFGAASAMAAGSSTFGQTFGDGFGATSFGTTGGFGSFPTLSQFDITPISVEPAAPATSNSNPNPFGATPSTGGMSGPLFGSAVSSSAVGGSTPAAPAAPISFGTSSNVVPMPATLDFSAAAAAAASVFDAGQDSNMSAGDTAWASIGDEFLGDDHDMESTPPPGSMSPVTLNLHDADSTAPGKPDAVESSNAQQEQHSLEKSQGAKNAQNDEKDDQLARLKAKIQEKRKRLQEQMKMREASPPRAPRSPTRSPLTVEDSTDPLPEKKSPVKAGGDAGEDGTAGLAERNALRFAATSERPLTSFLPFDLKEKAKNYQAAESTETDAEADESDAAIEPMALSRKAGKSLVGTCPHMCPDEELLRREAEGDIQTLENPSPSDIHPSNWTLRDTAVKRFRRSAADYKLDIPELVRPPHVLEQVCGYLEEWVMERDRQGPDKRFPGNQPPPPLDVYQFVWDRTRMIRKDFILQNYIGSGGKCCAAAVRTHERVARWHILCEHQLSHLPEFVTMQSQQNIQELGQTMKTLNLYYDDAHRRSTVEEPGTPKSGDGAVHGCRSAVVMGPNPVDYDGNALDNTPPPADSRKRIIGVRPNSSVSLGTAEPEMRALYILVVMDNDGGMEVLKYAGRLCIERPDVYKSKPVQLALSVYKAKKALNYAKFFSLLRAPSTPYLFACIMFKYVEHMRKVAFRIMSKTFGMKRRDTGDAAYDTYPMRRLVPLLCFEDADEARDACRHYNICVQKIPGAEGTESLEVILWRHGDFREPKDPTKGTNIALWPRKMTRTIEAKLKGATRLAVCRGDVSGEGALLAAHSHESAVFMGGGAEQKQKQEEAERNRLLMMQEEEKAREVELLLQQREMERKRLEEEKQRQELAKAEEARRKREEEARRKREEEARRKKEEEEAAAAAAAKRKREEALRKQAEEEARRKKEAERLRKLKEEEERKRKQKEEEERRRREVEEARRKMEEAARKKREEERRKREEEERRALREALEKKRQEEARRKKLAEEEKERQRLIWRKKMDSSRKLLLWKRWVAYAQRHSMGEGECANATFNSMDLSGRLVGFVKSNEAKLAFGPQHNANVPSTNRLLYQLGTATERINLGSLMRDEFFESERFAVEYEQCKAIPHLDMFSTVLFKVGLVVTGTQDSDNSHEMVVSWLRSRLFTGCVQDEKVKIGSNDFFVKTVVVDGTWDVAKLEGSDALLFVIPPISTHFGGQAIAGAQTLQMLHRYVHRDAAMMVLSFDHGRSSELQSKIVKQILGENADNEDGLVRTTIDEENFHKADSALMLCCKSLVSSFVARFSTMDESSTSVARLSIAGFGLERLREALWAEAVEEELPLRLQEKELLFKLKEVVKMMMEEVDHVTSLWKEKPLELWPAKEFAGSNNHVADYFLPFPGSLSLTWRESGEVVSSELKNMFGFIVENSSLGEMVGSVLFGAEAAYCQRLVERNHCRSCIEFVLQRWEQQQPAGTVLYLAAKLAPTLTERMAGRLREFSRNVAGRNWRHLEYSKALLHAESFATLPFPETLGGAVKGEAMPLVGPSDAASLAPSLPPVPESGTRTASRRNVGVQTPNVGLETPHKSPAKRRRPDSEERRLDDDDDAAKKQREGTLSRAVMESRAFTRALEGLLRGDMTMDVDVGGTSLADLLVDCESPRQGSKRLGGRRFV